MSLHNGLPPPTVAHNGLPPPRVCKVGKRPLSPSSVAPLLSLRVWAPPVEAGRIQSGRGYTEAPAAWRPRHISPGGELRASRSCGGLSLPSGGPLHFLFFIFKMFAMCVCFDARRSCHHCAICNDCHVSCFLFAMSRRKHMAKRFAVRAIKGAQQRPLCHADCCRAGFVVSTSEKRTAKSLPCVFHVFAVNVLCLVVMHTTLALTCASGFMESISCACTPKLIIWQCLH
jgi:hypothetical protein